MNKIWEQAARFADTLPDMDARMAVTVVPIFSPRIMAAADSNPIHPREHMMSVMATVALDDWTIIVRTVPMKRKMRVERNPILANLLTKRSTSGFF